MDRKDFKELEIILSSFACDKNCPYCTAKITQWDKVEDDIHLLSLNVGQMKQLGYKFHYVTIGGNGEPTLQPYSKLKDLVEMFDGWDIPVKRVLTSGNVFREKERAKYDLFVSYGWMFEVTVTDADMSASNRLQGYDWDYMETDAFKKARVRLNYVLLNKNMLPGSSGDESGNKFIRDIKELSEKHPNIETLAVKLLNPNTLMTNEEEEEIINRIRYGNGEFTDRMFELMKDSGWRSSWVLKNAVLKRDRQQVADILNENFTYKGEAYDTHSWEMENGKEVYFSWKKVEYGLYDLVWYGNRFVNYQLDTVDIDLMPRVYVASRFIKEKTRSGYSFAKDFRVQLIGEEGDFVDFNNHSFIRDSNGKTVAQYLGPFYNEKASDGMLTSTACDEVVNTENMLIEKCDVFICYFDEIISPGGISELIYAAMLGKKIVIFYKTEDDISYSMKTSAWYPVTFAMIKADCCVVKPVHDVVEIKKQIPEILKDM